MKSLSKKWILAATMFVLTSSLAFSQFVVSDPIHTGISIASKILHIANQITEGLHLDEVLKAAEKLKKVSNGIKTFHRITQTITNIKNAGQHYQQAVKVITTDKHFKPAEMQKILLGYESLLRESNNVIKDLNQGTQGNFLEMKDGERLAWIEKVCDKANQHIKSIEQYTASVRAISTMRAKTNGDYRITVALYGFSDDFSTAINSNQYSLPNTGTIDVNYGDTAWNGYGRTDALSQAKGQSQSEDEVAKSAMGAYQWNYNGTISNTTSTTTTERNTSNENVPITRNTNTTNSSNTKNTGTKKSTGCMKYDKTGPYWDPNCTDN